MSILASKRAPRRAGRRSADVRSRALLLPDRARRRTQDARVAREEIFGPVLSVVRFADLAEAVEITNATGYGLSAGVWSRDIDTALGYARATKAGTVWINCYMDGFPEISFGGYGASGIGRELGRRRSMSTSSTRARSSAPAARLLPGSAASARSEVETDVLGLPPGQRTPQSALQDETKAAANAALEVAAGKVSRLVTDYPDYFPSTPITAAGSTARKPGPTGAKASWAARCGSSTSSASAMSGRPAPSTTASWSRNVSTTTRSTIWASCCAPPGRSGGN